MHVYLLHGLGADARAFQRFTRLISGDFESTAINLLGHGTAAKPTNGYNLTDHAQYIATQIADVEGATWLAQELDSPPALVGHSYGAAVAVALAAEFPNLVAKLVLLDPVVDPYQRSESSEFDQARQGTRRMIEAKKQGTLPETVAELFAAESSALQNWIVETWEMMSQGVLDELDPDWMRFTPRVQCPVTIIHGDSDLGGAGDESAKYFDNPTVVRIAGAGHYLHATHARETAAAVIDALIA